MAMIRNLALAAGLLLAPFSSFAAEPAAAVTNSTPPAVEVPGATDLMGVHAIALHGTPKYPAGFTHYNYTNPDAPKGGLIRLGGFGSFDNLNPFILKGEAADGLPLMYDTLLVGSGDEPFTEYGLLAKTIDLPADRSWVAFDLRPEATFSDGRPVTADDIVWSFNTLKAEGAPFYRAYYTEVVKAEAESPTRVKFTFAEAGNRELPLIVGQMPVLPRHYWESKKFADTTLTSPVGSGPYAIETFTAGRSITFRLRSDYWGRDLPVNKGRYNFGQIRYDYYRDLGVMFEAFKAGDLDFRLENSARNWAVGYNVPAVTNGRLIKESIQHEDPQGMQGFMFNTRREIFKDVRVRRAIATLMDFEWMNANLFYGQYKRTLSYFANSDLASSGLPEGQEMAILSAMREQVPASIFTTPYTLPVTKGDGNIRPQLAAALQLLKDAGYAPKSGVMTSKATGTPLKFEFLLIQEDFVRVVQPFVKNLERIGIKATLRVVDSSQYINRLNDFDFDMIVTSVPNSLSPGNEQLNFWGSAFADQPGSRNYAGVKDPAVDSLIAQLIKAPDRETLVAITHALDRVLLAGWYVVPQWHLSAYRVGYWNRFSHPEIAQKHGLGFMDTWWVDPAKAAALTQKP